MDVGHSRLLKFFTDKPKMEKHTLKIEVLAPTDIESEVPRHQKLREPTEPKEPPKPTQLQNDQPIEWTDLRDMMKKPVYVGIRDEVIRTPQRIRVPRVADETPAVEDKTSSEDKPETRIPVSRFRPAVERVQRERRESREGNEKSKREAPEKPKRTSIPKLRTPVTRKYPIADEDQTIKVDSVHVKEAKDGTSEKNERRIRRDRIPVLSKDHYKIVKRDDNAQKPTNKNKIDTNQSKQEESVKQDSNEKLNDEFDKLYEEIVDTDTGSLPVEILETKVKDPEKLESKFEEIVHQYDETVEQVNIEPVDKARYSKIPLFRRRSSQDVKIPKQFERTLSLKIGDKKIKSDEKTKAKIKIKDDEIKPNGVIENSTVESPTEPDCELAQEVSFEINNNNDGENHDIAPQSPNPTPSYNTIPTPDSERVKVGIFGISTREIPLEDNASQDLDVTTPVLETVKLALIDIPAEEQFKNVSIETEDTKPVHVKENTISTQNDTFKEGEEVEVIKALDRVISIESDDILDDADVIQNEPELKINNDVNDQKERIKTATIHNDTIIKNIENSTNVPQDILIPKLDDELKSVGLLQKSNNVKERNTSRYVMKPVSNERDKINDPTLVEEIPITKGNVSKILKRLTSQELSNNYFSEDNDIDVKKQEIDVKKELDDIPKKKSVLSKIAMFEHAEPEPPFKPPHRYAKPKRTISEEIRHSPKIVQEVLKPKGEQTDQHTIVTVDIMKPVEIITNNEEQVTIVENLSEKVIEFENLDTSNLNRVEPIEIIEAEEETITHEKETIIRDDSRLYNTEIEGPEDTTEDIEAGDLNFEDDVNTTVPQYIESNHNDQNSVTEIIRPDYIETLESSHINSNNNIPYGNNDEYKTPEPSGNIPTREHKPKHSIRKDDYKLTLPNNIESMKKEFITRKIK